MEDQNVFKILSLVPLGTLLLCVARNVVGLPTSGTFMPLLIALAFQETSLPSGLALFVGIVAAGLLVRAYLSTLNLLLVPRISAVVVVVIVLMGLLVIGSERLGIEQGMTITFFPFVVIAWTIERLSTVWEEQGHAEALRQCVGSLAIAVVAYLVWQVRAVQQLLFTFSELNLIVLALILAVGSYTGYRLSELARFQPLAEGVDASDRPDTGNAGTRRLDAPDADAQDAHAQDTGAGTGD